MSKRDEKIALYKKASAELGLGLSDDLITKVTVGLGPSIYSKDAECVSCSDDTELSRVRENFLKKKLGLTKSDDELNVAIRNVCQKLGSSNRHKYRALFYALLAQDLGKTSIYA